jgi:hypothetical protein
MSPKRTLWRLDGVTATTAIDYERLAEGLRLHVAHSPLTTVAMRIGDRQQCYVILGGCDGCLRDQCQVGCHAALFRRLTPTCMTGVDLSAVSQPQGFARRPYQRGVLARPGPDARPLDAALLHRWQDARLMVHWTSKGSTIRTSALILSGAEDPHPAEQLRGVGWRPLPLPSRLVLRSFQRSMPPALPFGAHWKGDITLLTPPTPTQATDGKPELSDSAAPVIAE